MDSDMTVPPLDQFVLTVRNLANSGEYELESRDLPIQNSARLEKYI